MRTRIFFVVFPPLVIALFLGILLAPTGKEVALMQFGSSESEQSLQTYTALHSKGDNSINVLAPLVNLHLHYGDVDKAIALLEDFAASNPDNVGSRKRLAELYKASQRYHNYCALLEEIQKLSPSTEILRELAIMYDFLGDYKNEMNALVRILGQGGDTFLEEDYVKLARFYRIEGDREASIRTLDLFFTKKGNKASPDTLYLLVQLLLENADETKAYQTATRYLKKRRSEELALKFSELFQFDGKIDSAYAILEPYLANIDRSFLLKKQVVSLLFSKGRLDDVYQILFDDFSRDRLAGAFAEPLIDLAQQRKNDGLVEAVLRKADFNEISSQTLLRYVDLSMRQKQKNIASVINTRINRERLEKEEPLLAAMLKIATSNAPEAVSALAALSPDDLALPEERLMAAHVLYSHGKAKQAQSMIAGLPAMDVLNAFDPPDYALLHLDDPQLAARAEQQLEDLKKAELPSESRRKADQARLYLKIGVGDAGAVNLWFQEHAREKAAFLEDALGMANRFHQAKIALAIAERLYKSHPTGVNRAQLIDSLIANKHYPEALALLQPEIEKDPQKLSDYADILSSWVAQIKNSDKNFVPMHPFAQFALRHMSHDKKGQHEMVFILQEAGLKTEAESLLVNLAAGLPFASSEVQELLGFWGDKPSPAALAWITGRASNANDDDRAKWLSHLIAVNQPQAVLDILQDQTESGSPAVMDIYLDALRTVRSPDLGKVLLGEIEKETDGERMKRLVVLAEQEGIQDVRDKGWLKVYAFNPDDPEAVKYIALQEANANHYSAALPLLRRALKNNPDDYQLSLAYAGILQHKKKKSEAQTFYDKAFDQLSEVQDKTFYERLSMAHLLYKSKGLTESAELFRELIKEYPDNKSLRADFAEILMENKQYDEASIVLSP